jgi:PAS domain S-box-containing protein
MDTEPARVVIVDDAADVRTLLKTRLRLSGALEVVGEGADGGQAVALAHQHRPDLMLLDVSMPGMDGLEALPKIREASPGTRVVLFSGFEEAGLAETAQRLGAAAFIEKSEPVDSLVHHLLEVLAGDVAQWSATAGDAGAAPVSQPERRDVPASSPDQGVLDDHLERFREVFEEAAIGMATMTLTGRLVRVNRALANLLHRRAEELVGRFYGQLTEGRDKQLADALDDIGSRPLEVAQIEHAVRGRRRSRWVRATLAPVRDRDGRPLYVFLQVQDITNERAAHEELRRSEERFRLLVEAVEDYAIFMLDPTGHIASWNAGAQRSKGYTADEIIGRHFRVFYPPDVAARGHPEHELELAIRDGHYEEEGWRLRKDGSRFWANVLITAIFNDAGEHIGFTKVTRDTTERRMLEQERESAVEALATANGELESLNERLQQAANDQSKFLAVTAHELRTPIGVLGGSADTLSRHWPDLTAEERTELLDAMGSSTTRLRRLLADLLTASRLQSSALEMHRESVPVDEIVRHAIATVRRTDPAADVALDPVPEVTVAADRDRLSQAVDNLLTNALRHGTPPVRVTVRVQGPNVQVRVGDQGAGVDPGLRARLFTRFAAGRSRGGTGLGLFIVRELARAHGGEAFYDPPSAQEPAGAFVLSVPRGHAE